MNITREQKQLIKTGTVLAATLLVCIATYENFRSISNDKNISSFVKIIGLLCTSINSIEIMKLHVSSLEDLCNITQDPTPVPENICKVNSRDGS